MPSSAASDGSPALELGSPPVRAAPDADVGEVLGRALRTLAGRAGTLVLSFAFAVAVARTLSPSERGDFALLQALNALTVILVNLAVAKAVLYEMGRGRMPAATAKTAASGLALLSGAVAAAVVLPLALLLREGVLPGLPPTWIAAAVLLATPLLVREYVGGVLMATDRPVRLVGSTAVQPGAGLIALLAMSLLLDATLGDVVLAWSLGILLSAAVAYGLATTPRGEGRPGRRDLLALARFGFRSYGALVARFLNLRLDQFLVRILASSAVLGQYAVAVSVGELLIQVPNIMLWALAGPISASAAAAGAGLTVRFSRFSLLLQAVLVVAIAALAPAGVPFVFGEEYRPAVGSLLFLLPGMVLYAPAAIISEYFILQRGRPGLALVIAGSSVVSSAVLNVPLTPALGANGASIASSLSYGVMLGTALLLFARATGVSPTRVFAIERADVADLLSVVRRARRAGPMPEGGVPDEGGRR